MRLFVGIFLCLLSNITWSFTIINTQVSKLDTGKGQGEETLVFLSSGLVAKVFSEDKEMLKRIHQANEKQSWINIQLDQERRVINIEEIKAPLKINIQSEFTKRLSDYRPTLISSPAEAHRIFMDAKINHKESQCYNRAHIWAYEWRANHNLFTSKAWIFFTRKYIRKYDFSWWFHVAPYFHVLDEGKVWERIADVKYARTPIKLKQWSDIFMRNNSDCPVVNNYSEQANHPESGWCFIIKSSMYYYQPLDLESLEQDGTERNVWNPSEIRQAYKEAFDVEI